MLPPARCRAVAQQPATEVEDCNSQPCPTRYVYEGVVQQGSLAGFVSVLGPTLVEGPLLLKALISSVLMTDGGA